MLTEITLLWTVLKLDNLGITTVTVLNTMTVEVLIGRNWVLLDLFILARNLKKSMQTQVLTIGLYSTNNKVQP